MRKQRCTTAKKGTASKAVGDTGGAVATRAPLNNASNVWYNRLGQCIVLPASSTRSSGVGGETDARGASEYTSENYDENDSTLNDGDDGSGRNEDHSNAAVRSTQREPFPLLDGFLGTIDRRLPLASITRQPLNRGQQEVSGNCLADLKFPFALAPPVGEYSLFSSAPTSFGQGGLDNMLSRIPCDEEPVVIGAGLQMTFARATVGKVPRTAEVLNPLEQRPLTSRDSKNKPAVDFVLLAKAPGYRVASCLPIASTIESILTHPSGLVALSNGNLEQAAVSLSSRHEMVDLSDAYVAKCFPLSSQRLIGLAATATGLDMTKSRVVERPDWVMSTDRPRSVQSTDTSKRWRTPSPVRPLSNGGVPRQVDSPRGVLVNKSLHCEDILPHNAAVFRHPLSNSFWEGCTVESSAPSLASHSSNTGPAPNPPPPTLIAQEKASTQYQVPNDGVFGPAQSSSSPLSLSLPFLNELSASVVSVRRGSDPATTCSQMVAPSLSHDRAREFPSATTDGDADELMILAPPGFNVSPIPSGRENCYLQTFHSLPPSVTVQFTPRSEHSPNLTVSQKEKSETSDERDGASDRFVSAYGQPMTLPQIHSHLNPNAPDFVYPTICGATLEDASSTPPSELFPASEHSAVGSLESPGTSGNRRSSVVSDSCNNVNNVFPLFHSVNEVPQNRSGFLHESVAQQQQQAGTRIVISPRRVYSANHSTAPPLSDALNNSLAYNNFVCTLPGSSRAVGSPSLSSDGRFGAIGGSVPSGRNQYGAIGTPSSANHRSCRSSSTAAGSHVSSFSAAAAAHPVPRQPVLSFNGPHINPYSSDCVHASPAINPVGMSAALHAASAVHFIANTIPIIPFNSIHSNGAPCPNLAAAAATAYHHKPVPMLCTSLLSPNLGMMSYETSGICHSAFPQSVTSVS